MGEGAVQALGNLILSIRQGGELNAVHSNSAILHSQLDELYGAARSGDVRALDDFLRESVTAAVSLSTLSLPSLTPATTLESKPLRPALATLLRATAACHAALGVLRCTLLGLQQGCHLEPEVVVRLASCANFAFGPAAEAAQLMCAEATNIAALGSQTSAASTLAKACEAVFETAALAMSVLWQVGDEDPAAALLATVCNPEKAATLCHKLAPALQWCVEQQVMPQAALQSLSMLLAYHTDMLHGSKMLLQDGPCGPELACLAARHYASLCKWLLCQPVEALSKDKPSSYTTIATATNTEWGGHFEQDFVAGLGFLNYTKPWMQLQDMSIVVTYAAAATVRLHGLARQGKVTVELHDWAVEALANLAAALLQPDLELRRRQQQLQEQQQPQPQLQPHQQQQQKQQQVPPHCIEAAAACCSGLAAMLMNRHLSAAALHDNEEMAAEGGCSRWFGALAAVGSFHGMLGLALHNKTFCCYGAMRRALGAAEAALRLSASLTHYLHVLVQPPEARTSGWIRMAVQANKGLLGAAGAVVSCAFVTIQQAQQLSRNSGKSTAEHLSCCSSSSETGECEGNAEAELVALACNVAHLAASATKLAEVQLGALNLGSKPLCCSDELYRGVVGLLVLLSSVQNCKRRREQAFLERLVGGHLIPLLGAFLEVSSPQPGMVLHTARSEGGLLQLDFSSKLSFLAGLLAQLDTLRLMSPGLRVQESVMEALRVLWQSVCEAVDELPAKQRQLVLGAPGIAASYIAEFAAKWQRSAYIAMKEGLVTDVSAWASKSAYAAGRDLALVKGLLGAWSMVAAIADSVLQQTSAIAAAPAAATAAIKLLHDVRQLPACKQRKQLSSPKFWQEVQRTLLPALNALASAATASDPVAGGTEQRLCVARALTTRVCANPACMALRGCSEGRMRSRRCSGCGVARYCSRGCQLEDFAAHCRVCSLLAAEETAG